MERKNATLTDMSDQKCEKKGKNIVFPRKVRNYTKVWILVFLAHCELQCRFGSNPELYFLVFWFRLDISQEAAAGLQYLNRSWSSFL